MNKSFHPILSEEKFAAWLDGMLPADEMSQLTSIISEDNDLQSISAIANEMDDTLLYNEDILQINSFAPSFLFNDFYLPDIKVPLFDFHPSPVQITLTPDFLPDDSFNATDNDVSANDVGQDMNDIN